MPTPTPTPAEGFATILLWLSWAVAARSAGGNLSPTLMALIIGRIRRINQRVARLAALIRDGRYVPRRAARPRAPVRGRPRRPDPLPRHFGWLLPLVPQAVGYRAQLETLLRDPEMAALLAAAPVSMARPLRSLCRMLRVDPPEILAPPRPALREAAPAVAKKTPQWPPHPSPPGRAASEPPPPACACGPPMPA